MLCAVGGKSAGPRWAVTSANVAFAGRGGQGSSSSDASRLRWPTPKGHHRKRASACCCSGYFTAFPHATKRNGRLLGSTRRGVARGHVERRDRPRQIGASAGRHGHELLRAGRTVGQVVHEYGAVCRSITELAVRTKTPIAGEEFQTLNLCFDDAVARGALSPASQG